MKPRVNVLSISFCVAINAHGQANTSLSNLSTTIAINHSLIPNTSSGKSLGSPAKKWKSLYLSTSMYSDSVIIGSGGLHINTQGSLSGLNAGVSVLNGSPDAPTFDDGIFAEGNSKA